MITFQPISSQNLTVAPKSENYQKLDLKNKSRYTRNTAPCDPRENNSKIVTSEWQEKAHTSIIPGPK